MFDAALGDFINTVLNGLWRAFYAVWRVLAGLVVLLEQMFRMLAGIGEKKVTMTEGNVASGGTERQGDIVSLLLTSDIVKEVFAALVVISIVLLLFFAILQIIRENYKNKDGGNPYMIVFRTFKGMITFLFITAAVIVGLTVSGYVLRGDIAIVREAL